MDTATLLKGTSIYLVGMMGCGKSTIGPMLAAALAYRYFDTDQLIEQAAQQTISQIFAESGEAVFRRLETNTLAALTPLLRSVISTGGGIILKPENWGHLRNGVIVWLDVAPAILHDRLMADTTRPLLQNGDLREKLDQLDASRRSLYAQADISIVVGASETSETIVDRILQSLTAACQNKAKADAEIQRLNRENPYQLG